jgi:hypothetical protein
MLNNSPQIYCVPQNDSCHNEIQAACSMTLVFIRTVTDFTESVKEYGSAQGVFRFAFV